MHIFGDPTQNAILFFSTENMQFHTILDHYYFHVYKRLEKVEYIINDTKTLNDETSTSLLGTNYNH